MLSDPLSESHPKSVHQTAETSRNARQTIVKKDNDRLSIAKDLLAAAGPCGMTRHELAQEMSIPLSSICSLANRLVKDGIAIEAGDTRLSPYGRPAAIVRIRQVSSDRRA